MQLQVIPVNICSGGRQGGRVHAVSGMYGGPMNAALIVWNVWATEKPIENHDLGPVIEKNCPMGELTGLCRYTEAWGCGG